MPRKNVRELGGRPLVAWSIEAGSAVAEVVDVLVSTDDVETAELSRSAGGLVPWLRPAALATDTAGSVDVVLHAVDWYEGEFGGLDGVLLLQPTSPFRKMETLRRGIALFATGGGESVVSVGPAASHPFWCVRAGESGIDPYFPDRWLSFRSQDLPPAYVLNGSFYLTSPESLRTRRSFFSPSTIPLVVEAPEENIDIDTEWDWMVAEAWVRARGESGADRA